MDHSCRVDVRPQRGVGVDDLADHPDRRLRREPEQPLQLGVEPFLHIMPTAHPRGMHPVRQPGRGLVADSQGLAQRSRLILGRQHAHLDHLLHTRTLNADTDRSSAVATVRPRSRTSAGKSRCMMSPVSLPSATCRSGSPTPTYIAAAADYNLHAHLVFVTKYRRPVITDTMLTFCEHLRRSVCTDMDTELREFNDETDHVNLLVHYPPSLPISQAGQPTQRRVVSPATPAVSRRCAEIPAGQAFLVTVLLRRLLRRRTPDHHQAVHRPAETTRLICD